MAGIKEIEDKIKLLSNSNAISQVKFARIAEINWDAQNQYPLLLFVPTTTVTTEARKKNLQENQTFDFFLADREREGDIETRSQKFDRLRRLLIQTIQDVSENNFVLLNAMPGAVGWEEHNDQVVVVKRTATFDIFDCIA